MRSEWQERWFEQRLCRVDPRQHVTPAPRLAYAATQAPLASRPLIAPPAAPISSILQRFENQTLPNHSSGLLDRIAQFEQRALEHQHTHKAAPTTPIRHSERRHRLLDLADRLTTPITHRAIAPSLKTLGAIGQRLTQFERSTSSAKSNRYTTCISSLASATCSNTALCSTIADEARGHCLDLDSAAKNTAAALPSGIRDASAASTTSSDSPKTKARSRKRTLRARRRNGPSGVDPPTPTVFPDPARRQGNAWTLKCNTAWPWDSPRAAAPCGHVTSRHSSTRFDFNTALRAKSDAKRFVHASIFNTDIHFKVTDLDLRREG